MPNLSELINAFIGFLLSVVLGAFFQRWLSRAKPSLIIRAVGFQGSDKPIRLSEKALELSKQNPWLSELNPYTSFDDLLAEHKDASETIERLRISIPLATDWLREKENDKTSSMSLLDVKKYPFISTTIIQNSITGMIRRNEAPRAPVGLDKVQDYERLTDLDQTKDGLVLFLGERSVVWKLEDVDNESRKKDLELCAESLARGIKQNLIYYIQCFINSSNKEINELNEYKQLLEESLLPEARLSVELSIYNSGQSATAIRPHMGLKILHTSFEKKPYILSVQKQSENHQQKDNSPQKRRKGIEVITESFLPETSATPYLSVSPGEMQEVTLVAVEPLGKTNGELIKNIYRTGLLTCRIIGQTITGNNIWSSTAVFSNQITSEEKAKLEKYVVSG